jgi:hypothetical protein
LKPAVDHCFAAAFERRFISVALGSGQGIVAGERACGSGQQDGAVQARSAQLPNARVKARSRSMSRIGRGVLRPRRGSAMLESDKGSWRKAVRPALDDVDDALDLAGREP